MLPRPFEAVSNLQTLRTNLAVCLPRLGKFLSGTTLGRVKN